MAAMDSLGFPSLRTKASRVLFMMKHGAKQRMMRRYAVVLSMVSASAPKRAAMAGAQKSPARRNTPPAASASPTVLVYTRLASFSCPWNMKMENRVPPPAPIIRPVALMTLYTEIARLRAARPLVPSALDTKYVSARI